MQPSIPDLMSIIKELQRRVGKLETAPRLGNSAISEGDLVVNAEGAIRSSDFESGAAGYRLSSDQLEVNDILLRGGIIGNDALANPVRVGGSSVIQNGISTTTVDQAYAPATIAVPAGFSQALIFLNVYVGLVNSTTSGDFLYVQARINGVDSREIPIYVTNANYGGTSTAKSTLLTGLPDGSSVSVAAAAHSQNAPWAANASNRAATEAIAIFLR